MKVKDVLITESVTDIVARFYREAGENYDKFFNPEDVKYKTQNKEYYDKHFKEWFSKEIVPVFTKPTTRPQPMYSVQPKDGKLQSPGYRGKQYALARAGAPYDHKVQKYNPSYSDVTSTTPVDGTRNNG